ncbi:uncharacterized protein TNCV_5130101 [Trichonephila clavipes]|nr:uncharacterized protein TNCV_5130101 [Trichonephila clavipes]
MGKLLTGNVVTLHSGLTAVESKLGWMVFGKQKFCGKDKFTTLSMHVGNIPLQNLWELEVLGITDRTETVKEREDLSDFRGKMRILPEGRPVIKLNSQTTKVRPVFDASASQRGKLSLNECLHKGINLLEMIPDILDRFRMFPIGISANIEKTFLMLSVAPKDRDFLRFFSVFGKTRNL